MPNGKTQNYHLNQWEKSDQVLMEDFNADNLAIDSALAAEKAARESAIRAETDARTQADTSLSTTMNTELAKRGNCQMWVYTYVGNGLYGESSRTRITFPQKPELIILFEEQLRWHQTLTPDVSQFSRDNLAASVSWSGNTMSFYSAAASSQLNTSGRTYKVIAFWTK